MIGGFGVAPDPVEQFVVCLDIHAGSDFVCGDALHGGRRHDAAGDAHGLQRDVAIELGAEEIEADRRAAGRRFGGDVDAARALRTQDVHDRGDAGALRQLEVVVSQERNPGDGGVGRVQSGAGADIGADWRRGQAEQTRGEA